jgi:opacity protein-like surface antigen
MKKALLTAVMAGACWSLAHAQTYVEASVGTSNQDAGSLNLAVRQQFSETFRAGLELQTGAVRYRFIEAKAIDEGVSSTLSLPLAVRLYQFNQLRLDFYGRIGLRYQNVEDQFATEKKLQNNNSVAFNVEPGLQVSLALSERLNLQSGVTLPNFFELRPAFLYENNNTNLFLGVGYQVAPKAILMFKANAGPAAGASGDSQKFNWGVQAGVRFSLKNPGAAALRLDPTF